MDSESQHAAMLAAERLGERHGRNAAGWAFGPASVRADYILARRRMQDGTCQLRPPGVDDGVPLDLARYSVRDLCVALDVPPDLTELTVLRANLVTVYEGAAAKAFWASVDAQIDAAVRDD